jgi:hypothetical protein
MSLDAARKSARATMLQKIEKAESFYLYIVWFEVPDE